MLLNEVRIAGVETLLNFHKISQPADLTTPDEEYRQTMHLGKRVGQSSASGARQLVVRVRWGGLGKLVRL